MIIAYNIYMEKKEIVYYLREISNCSFLNKKEEREILIKAKNGDSNAKSRLIKAHLPLVVNIAKDYINHGLPLADLIQEGNIALIQAVDKFDLKWENRFNTYATYCIRQNILRSIYNMSRIIRLPVYLYERILKLKHFSDNYFIKHGKRPDIEIISTETGISEDKIRDINKNFEKILSLDDYSFGVTKNINETEHSAIDNFFNDELSIAVKESMHVLNQKEKEIIEEYFGLNSDSSRTLKELSEIYSLTKERIRQIKNSALKKLSESQKLSLYYYESIN
jgi:RNA polymerase primary sigma factor